MSMNIKVHLTDIIMLVAITVDDPIVIKWKEDIGFCASFTRHYPNKIKSILKYTRDFTIHVDLTLASWISSTWDQMNAWKRIHHHLDSLRWKNRLGHTVRNSVLTIFDTVRCNFHNCSHLLAQETIISHHSLLFSCTKVYRNPEIFQEICLNFQYHYKVDK